MTLSAEECIRRFLLHVLPNGFRRIRYYGFLGNRNRQEKLDRCRRLLGMATPQQAAALTPDENRQARYAEIVGSPLHQCPRCRQGRMVVVEILSRSSVAPARAIDSS
jgi:hypothetical protein